MPADGQYQEQIRQLGHDGLVELWEQIVVGDTPDWPPGKAFEYLILRAFELEGAAVRWPYTVEMAEEQLEQIDGVVYVEGLSCLCESKDYRDRVNVEPIAKLRNQLSRRPGTAMGIVFSRMGFTESGRILARFLSPQTILLWDGNEIEIGLRQQLMIGGLKAKFRYAVEEGYPDFNLIYLE